MPSALIYLAIMLAVIVIWFLLLKRPVYEAVLISFIILLTVTGKWGSIGKYIDTGLKTSLLYSMTAFCAMSVLLTKTKVVAIGPVTAETCGELGIKVAAMPEEYTIDALTSAVARLAAE